MPPYPWQTPLWQRVVDWVERDRLAHALLVAGPGGLGGLPLAQAMAHYLLCNAPMGPLACGKCRGCQLFASETHPDLFTVQPEAPSNAIKVDQVRQLTEFMSKTAQQGGRKVILLSPAEAMNMSAANALLKSLEEPTERTYLLLVSPEPSRLLATIRSRCAKLLLTAPPRQEALEWLTKVGVADAAELLADAGGEPLKVQRWFEQDFVAQRARMLSDLEELTNGRRSPLMIAKSWLEMQPVEVVDSLLVWVQAIIRSQQAGQEAETDLKHEAFQPLMRVPAQVLFRYWEKLAQTKKELLSQNNPNQELLLDELLMGWAALTAQSAGARPRMLGG